MKAEIQELLDDCQRKGAEAFKCHFNLEGTHDDQVRHFERYQSLRFVVESLRVILRAESEPPQCEVETPDVGEQSVANLARSAGADASDFSALETLKRLKVRVEYFELFQCPKGYIHIIHHWKKSIEDALELLTESEQAKAK